MKTLFSKTLLFLAAALLLLTATTTTIRAQDHPGNNAAKVTYGREFLLKIAGQTYAVEMNYPEHGEDPDPDSPGSPVPYKVRRMDPAGVYQEIATGTADPRKGEAWVVTPDFKIEWSTGNKTYGWLYLSTLPDGTEYLDGKIPAPAGEATPLEPSGWTPVKQLADPRTTCREYIEAMRRCDLDAAMACFAYQKKHEEALKVGIDLFMSQRRVLKAVEAKFGQNDKTRALFENWIRKDMTDAAIDRTTKHLERATVKVDERSSTAEIRWDDGWKDEDYLDLLVKELIKVDGVWKFHDREDDEDFFRKGGWGNLFRNLVESMNQTAAKVTAGEFSTIEELESHLEAGKKNIEQEYEKELIEANQEYMTRPSNGKKE